MNVSGLVAKVTFILAVVAAGYWALAHKMVDLPPTDFWAALTIFLIAVLIIWSLVGRHSREVAVGMPAKGLFPCVRGDMGSFATSRWFFLGGRPRLADIAARYDAPREILSTLIADLTQPVSGPSIHLLVGSPGTGRTALLYRLGQKLADLGNEVFIVLPAPRMQAIAAVLDAARRCKVVYLLIDDADLWLQTEETLYEVMRSGRSIVVIATVREEAPVDAWRDDLKVVRPATLLSWSTRHMARITPGDLLKLARTMGALRTKRPIASVAPAKTPPATADEKFGYKATVPYMQVDEAARVFWQDLQADTPQVRSRKIMLFLCGVAEVGVPVPFFKRLIHPEALHEWRGYGITGLEAGLVLPPHLLVCQQVLFHLGTAGPEVRAALKEFIDQANEHCPELAPRVLYGLTRHPQLRPVAVTEARRVKDAGKITRRDIISLWQPVFDELLLTSTEETRVDRPYPPDKVSLGRVLLLEEDYEQALEVFRSLLSDSAFARPARYNIALTLAHMEQYAEAWAELMQLDERPPEAMFFSGYLAEQMGEAKEAIAAYEAARRLDVLSLPAIRRLAFTYLRWGAPRAAHRLFELALGHTQLRAELYGGLAVANVLLGQGQRATAQSARAIQAGVEPNVVRNAVARAFLDHHMYDRVPIELEAALAYDPEDAEAWEGLAEAYQALEKFEREEQCLRKLVKAEPERFDFRLELGRCLRDLKRYPEALTVLQELVAEGHGTIRLCLLAAGVAGACGDAQFQVKMAQEALRLGDETGWGHFWLAEGLRGQGQDAVEIYRDAHGRLLKQVPNAGTPSRAARMWRAVAVCTTQMGEGELADEAVRRAAQQEAVADAAHSQPIKPVREAETAIAVSVEEEPEPDADTSEGWS